jgi:gamma-glutamyltranspeptidase / glutathione hydrolase
VTLVSSTSGNSRTYIVNPGPKPVAAGLTAAVTTDSAIVTETMVKVLRTGGNAVDSAIAGAMVQAAVEPFMTNHAGLVTCLFYEAKTRTVHQLDSLGAFPSGLSPFRPVPAGRGPYAVYPPSAIIPGFMPGLKEMHRRFGTREWSQLCADAVHWAEAGHPVSTFEYGMNVYGEKFITYFPEGRAFYQPRGMFSHVGEIFVPTGLAATLRGVAAHGPDYMISGPWAEEFVRKANHMGWMIRLEHMSEAPPRWLEPIRYPHHDYEVVSLGPPQAQGLYIAVVLGVLKHLGIRQTEPGSAEHLWAMGHALRQGMRHWEYAQDDLIYGVPRDEVLDDAYHLQLAKMIRKARPKVDLTEHIRLTGEGGVSSSDVMTQYAGSGGRPRCRENGSTQPSGSCEIAVVDHEGNWVQLMNTLQGSGIPGMVVGGVPMVGSHCTFGALTSPMDATLLKGAKPRCIIGNTFVFRSGKPVLSLGTPGNVHCTVPQVLTYALDFNLDPYAAVESPRMLPLTESRTLTIEDRLAVGVVEALNALGVRVAVTSGYDSHMGSFSVIARDEDTGLYTAIADPRRCAVAGGI